MDTPTPQNTNLIEQIICALSVLSAKEFNRLRGYVDSGASILCGPDYLYYIRDGQGCIATLSCLAPEEIAQHHQASAQDPIRGPKAARVKRVHLKLASAVLPPSTTPGGPARFMDLMRVSRSEDIREAVLLVGLRDRRDCA